MMNSSLLDGWLYDKALLQLLETAGTMKREKWFCGIIQSVNTLCTVYRVPGNSLFHKSIGIFMYSLFDQGLKSLGWTFSFYHTTYLVVLSLEVDCAFMGCLLLVLV